MRIVDSTIKIASNEPTFKHYTPESYRDVPFARVDCSGNEKRYVSEVIDSGWLTTASKAMEFEANFAKLLGVKHAIAVNSCTAGLHLALDATGVAAGDRVFVPSFTFTASAQKSWPKLFVSIPMLNIWLRYILGAKLLR